MKKYFFLCGVLQLLICFGCETLETQHDRQLRYADEDYRNEINKLEAKRDLKLYNVRQPPTSGTPALLLHALTERDVKLSYVRLHLDFLTRQYIFGLLSSLNDLPQTGPVDVDKATNEIYNEFYFKKSLLDAEYQRNVQSIQNNYVNRKLEEIHTVNMINAFNQSMYNLNQQIQYNNMINQQQHDQQWMQSQINQMQSNQQQMQNRINYGY